MRPSHRRLHPRGAHGSWSNSHFDAICTCLQQIFHSLLHNNIPCDQRNTLTISCFDMFDRFDHIFLISMCCIQNDSRYTKFDNRIKSLLIAIDAYCHTDIKSSLPIKCRGINILSDTSLFGKNTNKLSLLINNRKRIDTLMMHKIERITRRYPDYSRNYRTFIFDDMAHCSKWIKSLEIFDRKHRNRLLSLIYNYHTSMISLVNNIQTVSHKVLWRHHKRRIIFH